MLCRTTGPNIVPYYVLIAVPVFPQINGFDITFFNGTLESIMTSNHARLD